MPEVTSPPSFQAYRSAQFLQLLEKLYDLERIVVLPHNDFRDGATFFRSRKPLRGKDAFFLPFQFYGSLPQGVSAADCFKQMEAWSDSTGCNLTLSSLADHPEGRSTVVAHNPVLHLPGNEEALYRGFSSNLRNSLRRNANKATRLGVDFRHSTAEKDLYDFYYGVLAPQYVRKHRMVFHPFGLYRSLLINGMASLSLAFWEGRVIGGLVLIKDQGGVHYAWGASEAPEQLAVGALLLHFSILYALRLGLDWFDFGSTPLSDDDLLKFKMRWGCIAYPVRRYYTLRAPREIDLNSSFALTRRIYALLPPSWACSLMPRVIPWLVS